MPCSNLPAHLQNSCDNMDKVAMEIRPVLCVGRDEDLRLGHSCRFLLNCCTSAINRKKIFVNCIRDLCDGSFPTVED